MSNIKTKRIYENAEKTDGVRILVDRLWPRGMTKEEAAIDLWLKDIAPSNHLRKWFNHEAEKWPEFLKRYAEELSDKQDLVDQIKNATKQDNVTLVYAAKNTELNNAVALLELIDF